MSRRRVVIVPAWYPNAEDPVAGIFVREQAELVAARHDVVVLYPYEPGAPRRGLWGIHDADEDGIRTIRVRRRTLPLPKHELPLTVAAMRAALQRLRRSGFVPDVVHAHVFSAAAAARLAAGRRVPLVVTEHYSGLVRGELDRFGLGVARFAYRTADLVAAVSENLAARIVSLGVTTPVRVIPNSVDTDRFRPPVSGERDGGAAERVLLVGGLVPVKGIPVALEAMAALRRDRAEAVLEIAGDGPGRAEYEDLARRLGLGGVARFLGRLDRDEIAALMRGGHVLVSASESENLPGNQLEALATGLPVVATAVGGVPDLIDDEVGRLVPYGDADALAAALADVLDRRSSFDAARIAARTRERFGPARVAAMWDEIYDELARA